LAGSVLPLWGGAILAIFFVARRSRTFQVRIAPRVANLSQNRAAQLMMSGESLDVLAFSVPPLTEMFHFSGFAPNLKGWAIHLSADQVSPFGNPRIKAC